MSFEHARFREIPKNDLTEFYSNRSLKNELDKLGIDPAKLAVFLDSQGTIELRVLDFHHRSVDRPMPEPVRKGRGERKRVYCQLDIKGVGLIKPETHESKKEGIEKGSLAGYPEAYVIPGSTETPWGYDVLGLFDERLASGSAKLSEKLAAKGMRTEEYAALYRLNAVVIEGRRVGVEEFKKNAKQRFLDEARAAKDDVAKERYKKMARDVVENFDPVIGIRCMRSVFRIRDLRDAANPEQARIMLEEACANLNHEARLLGTDAPVMNPHEQEDREAYVRHIVYSFAKNAGIMHREGLAHFYLHMGNLSLAGEVVDLDSVTKIFRKKGGRLEISDVAGGFRDVDPLYGIPRCLIKDLRDMVVSVKKLVKAMKKNGFGVSDMTRAADAMAKGYADGLGDQEPFKDVGVTPGRLVAVLKDFLTEGLIGNAPLPAFIRRNA